MPKQRRRLQMTSLPALIVLSLLWTAVAQAALSESCSEIEFNGAAGAGSQDKVTFQIIDNDDPSKIILSESCVYTVEAAETAVDFLLRIPSQWGTGDGTGCGQVCSAPAISPPMGHLGDACTSDTDCDTLFAGDGVCGTRAKKTCGSLGTGFSCTVEARVSQKKGKCINLVDPLSPLIGKGCKTDADCGVNGECPRDPGDGHVRPCADAAEGETCLSKPAVLRVCCKESSDCSGSKLNDVSFGRTPVTIQTKVEPVPPLGSPTDCLEPPTYCPSEPDLPDDSVLPRQIAIDPIGGRSGPYRSQRDCRRGLQSAASAVTQATFNALKDCHRKVMNGQVPAGSCGTVNGTSDPSGSVAAATSALSSTVSGVCQASGHSASDFGYASCPAPCDGIDLGLCSAGTIGNICRRDRQCDTAPGVHDGICGEWGSLASCSSCLATATGVAAAAAAYGPSGPSPTLGAEVRSCQNTIGNDIAALLATDLKDVAKCQKGVDEFKLALSEQTPKCKDADAKGKRAKAREAIVADLTASCSNAALAQLDSCAANVAGIRHCVPRIAARVTAAVVDVAAPEGRCGNGKRNFGEKCDDGNTVDGDGCDSNCTPTGCGNEVISTGEECDDGNIQPGDGCDPTCHSEPQTCAPQMCSAFTFDCSTLFPGDCVCLQSAEGGGLCVNNFDCNSAQPCSSSVDCSTPGERCYLQTCCGGPLPGRCGPPTCTGQPG